jgi:hypothetical protein
MNGVSAAGLALLIAIACTGSSQPKATTTAPPSPPTAAPSPSAIITLEFSCRLPVSGYDKSGLGAFISFPARNVALASEGGLYYDRAVSRWVPVPRRAVSPDGRRYAYTDRWPVNATTAQKVHVVDAASGTELQVAAMPDTKPYQVVDFTSTGIYLHREFESTAPGVWRFDPTTAVLTKVSDGFYPPSGATWLRVVDPGDPHPQISALSGEKAPNRIDRRDEAGETKTWFYAPGYGVSWVAFASTPAIVVAALRQDNSTGKFEEVYWLVSGPDHAVRIAFETNRPGELAAGFGSAIADRYGIWIGGEGSLYLVRTDGAVLRVFDRPVKPANGCL